MPSHSLHHRKTSPNVIKDQARQGQFLGCQGAELLKGTFLNHYFTQVFHMDRGVGVRGQPGRPLTFSPF
jgi:hypothetical protein